MSTLEFIKAHWEVVTFLAGVSGTFTAYVVKLLWETSRYLAKTSTTLEALKEDVKGHEVELKEITTTVGKHEVKLAILEGHLPHK